MTRSRRQAVPVLPKVVLGILVATFYVGPALSIVVRLGDGLSSSGPSDSSIGVVRILPRLISNAAIQQSQRGWKQQPALVSSVPLAYILRRLPLFTEAQRSPAPVAETQAKTSIWENHSPLPYYSFSGQQQSGRDISPVLDTVSVRPPASQSVENELPRLQQELPRVQQELTQVQQELPSIQQSLPSVQQELPLIQQELPRYQQELPRLQQELPRLQQELPRLQQELPRLQQELPRLQEIPSLQQELPFPSLPLQHLASKKAVLPRKEKNVVGRPGIDYPTYGSIPRTSFSCKNQRYKGFFGDPEAGCQAWHYCDFNGGQGSFLCPNGTIFSQVLFTCDWWFNVQCNSTLQQYVINERLYKYIIPMTPSFPEDYHGPEVNEYLTLKFMELMQKEQKKLKEKLKNAEKHEKPTDLKAIGSLIGDNGLINRQQHIPTYTNELVVREIRQTSESKSNSPSS